MLISANSTAWRNFTRHLLKWEGKTSSDPRDTAARCFPGGIHTNKGITFCTFKEMAPRLGITPVTHARFLKLTDAEVARFMYEYYLQVNGQLYPVNLALAMTEAAFMSGASRALAHLREAVAANGLPARTTAQATQNAAKLPLNKLFASYQSARRSFLERLGASPQYSMFIRGWLNRLADFNAKFTPKSILPFFF